MALLYTVFIGSVRRVRGGGGEGGRGEGGGGRGGSAHTALISESNTDTVKAVPQANG